MSEEERNLRDEKEKLKAILKEEKGIDLVYGEFALIPAETIAETHKLKEEIEKLKELVYKDELTGALNRRGFMERFEPLFNEALRGKNGKGVKRKFELVNFSILFLDGDNFKSVNDTYGHDEGDNVLRGITRVLKENIREIDSVGRIGGEEFVVVLIGATEEDAYKKAEELRDRIKKEVKITSDQERLITVSIGVASLPESDADTFDELIAYADQSMYEAKVNRGKDNTVRWSELAKK